MTINSKFQNYAQKNLSPTEKEQKFISQEWERLKKILKEKNETMFRSGSYGRYTAITPVNDLDVIYPLPKSLKIKERFSIAQKGKIDPGEDINDVDNIIEELTKLLDSEYKKFDFEVEVKPQVHSIGIYFLDHDNFSIDVVPAFSLNEKNEFGESLFEVPEMFLLNRKKRIEMGWNKPLTEKKTVGKTKWIKSDPKGYKENAKQLNDKNSDFRKAVKFPKKWKFNCKNQNDNFPLKSFHIEAIITSYFEENSTITCFEAVDKFFLELPKFLKKPHFPDRANEKQLTDEYINDVPETEKKLVLDKQQKALEIIEKIKNEEFSDKELNELLNEEVKINIPASISRVKPNSQPYATHHEEVGGLTGIKISENDEVFLKKNFQR